MTGLTCAHYQMLLFLKFSVIYQIFKFEMLCQSEYFPKLINLTQMENGIAHDTKQFLNMPHPVTAN